MQNADYVGLLLVMATVGFIGNSYPFFARSQGWPVGKLFSGEATWPQASVILVPLSVGLAWYDFGFWYAVGVLVGGFVLAYILSVLLRQHVQVFWVLAFVVALVYGIARNADRFM